LNIRLYITEYPQKFYIIQRT